eukprot:2048400-Pleurochrysis_carterae.AAC.3
MHPTLTKRAFRASDCSRNQDEGGGNRIVGKVGSFRWLPKTAIRSRPVHEAGRRASAFLQFIASAISHNRWRVPSPLMYSSCSLPESDVLLRISTRPRFILLRPSRRVTTQSFSPPCCPMPLEALP